MNTKEAVKHEPGDWHVEAITTKDGTPMYRVLNRCGLGIGDFANWQEATLAASAPDLLAELKDAAEVIGQYKAYAERMRAELGRGFYPEVHPGDCHDYEESARAAILRATTGGK